MLQYFKMRQYYANIYKLKNAALTIQYQVNNLRKKEDLPKINQFLSSVQQFKKSSISIATDNDYISKKVAALKYMPTNTLLECWAFSEHVIEVTELLEEQPSLISKWLPFRNLFFTKLKTYLEKL